MAYEPKEGSGALFKSDKGDNPSRPDYRGDIMLDGVMYEISGWIKPKPSNPAEKFMSLSGKPKQARQQAPAPRQAPAAKQAFDPFDDPNGCPF
jgi:hypothetical protein